MTEIETRECITCERDLPKTDYYFRKHTKAKGGLTYKCKECTFKRKMFAKENHAICKTCEEELPQTSEYFYMDNHSAQGFFSNCKKCEGNSYAINGRYGLFDIRWKEIEHLSGIYKITCLGNGKYYIGSASNFCTRWSMHLHDLRKNKHHSDYMQNSYNKYDEDSFQFDILEYVKDVSLLIEREQHWIDKLIPYNRSNGFNTLRYAGNSLGNKLSEETKDKLSKALGKEINQYTLDGKLIATFQSANQASKLTKSPPSAVNRVANGIKLKERNFVWLYTNGEETIEERLFKIEGDTRKIIQYDLDGFFIKEWRLNVRQISDELGREFLDIPNNILGNSLSIGGYMWRYREGVEPLIEKLKRGKYSTIKAEKKET